MKARGEGTMVPRSSLKAGDVAVSSHYGISTVESIRVNAHEDGSTSIVWVKPYAHLIGQPGYEYLDRMTRSETYPNKSMIELLESASASKADDIVESIMEGFHLHMEADEVRSLVAAALAAGIAGARA